MIHLRTAEVERQAPGNLHGVQNEASTKLMCERGKPRPILNHACFVVGGMAGDKRKALGWIMRLKRCPHGLFVYQPVSMNRQPRHPIGRKTAA